MQSIRTSKKLDIDHHDNEDVLDESSSNYHTRKDQGRRSLGAPENSHMQKMISGTGKTNLKHNLVSALPKEIAVKDHL
jgi:hypothetical protein